MSENTVLNQAKRSSDTDEWYTTYETIQEELAHYAAHFKDKTVLCNCDDPFESDFAYYFLRHFNRLGLKKLICTSYAKSKIASIGGNRQLMLPWFVQNGAPMTFERGSVMIVTKMPGKRGEETDDETIEKTLRSSSAVKKLNGDGDFRSEECIEYLKACDICCTNPPFSLFSSLFSLLIRHRKQFLLICNQNAITYKEVFPHIKDNKAWIGYRFGDMAFRVPSDTQPRKTRFWTDDSGQKWRSLGNVMWLTNIDIPKRHANLELTETYTPEKYPKYDNFDAINVARVADIPKDYHGIMGVPITFLKYFNNSQFEIVGEANHGSDNEFDLFKPILNGKEQFKKILIKHRLNKVTMPGEFKMLDLFCGAGGFSYGMEKNPHFRTVVAIDFDAEAANTFKRNMPETNVIVGDITQIEVKEKVIQAAKELKVNMIIGGPPCQGFSMKGKKMGLNDPRNFLFREYLNIVNEIKPEIFIIENVKGLLAASNGWFKNEILSMARKLGYFVEYGIVNAADFGVPQARERAIFICSKSKPILLPEPTVSETTTVRDAIGDLSYLESGEGAFEQAYITEPKSEYQKRMREGCPTLCNHKASNHKQIAIDKLKMIPPEQGKECLPAELLGNQKFKTTWCRLKWDDISPTIDTRFDASSNGTNNHPYLNRAITPREAARLQSFDDKFIFFGSKVYIRKQIGNAVPPLMAKAIADKIFSECRRRGEIL